MDLSFLVILLVFAGLVLILPLIGKKWSAIISYVIFGVPFVFGLLGYLLRPQPPAGNSESMAGVALVIAGIAGSLILLTYLVYRFRNRKSSSQAS